MNPHIRKQVSIILSLSMLGAFADARAQQAGASGQTQPAQAQSSQPSGAAQPTSQSAAAANGSEDLEEVVVNGIRRGDLIMPTTVTSGSAFGLDLGVMDTPRNNTVLSKAQLDSLNVQNPGGFSYLTSSAYSDASFGQPNVPRIRGQYADMFYNGMRDSFTLNGYGAPISFNMVDSIDIVKGPASVQGGAGAGVGGSIDITTKMPSMTKFEASASAEVDNYQKRIFNFDVGGPLAPGLAGRVSFTSTDNGSFYYDMFEHQQSLYGALIYQVNPAYTISLSGNIADTTYRENDGINRVNQGLIDNGTYLTGAPPLSDVSGFGTPVYLTGSTHLNPRIIIDEPDGTGAHALHGMLQLIQTWRISDNFSIVNNTFYDYMNRYNQTMDYYADTAEGSYTLENKTDFKVDFQTGFVKNQIDAGVTYRYAHVLDIQNEANEPASVFDLSQNPDNWIFPAENQIYSGAIPYTAAFGHQQYGVPGSNSAYPSYSINSNLQDAAVFLEHRLTFSPQWSVMYGLRGDLVQLNDSDPLYAAGEAVGLGAGCVDYVTFYNSACDSLPQSQHTGWYGDYNGNISVVYSPTDWVSGYLTYNKTQYVYAAANDGAVGALGQNPATQLRQGTMLEEAGIKFDLLGKALFASIAGFHQERAVPVGQGGESKAWANIHGAEVELNYQPNSHLFATASYSYLHTTLSSPSSFWNFPAQSGYNIDGEGLETVWMPGQTFQDPGVPEHLFNVLVNYKLDNGLGFQANLQVTGPIQTSQGGNVDVAATEAAVLSDFGFDPNPVAALPAGLQTAAAAGAASWYFRPPTIPTQFTLNAAVFYNFLQHYTVKLEVYNLANKVNWQNDMSFYGNDFLTRAPPRSFDLTLSAKL